MKRIVLSILLITAVLPLFAQKNLDSWKRLDPLRGQEINFGLDFSNAQIMGQNANDFIASREDWKNEHQEIWCRMVNAFNSYAYKSTLGGYRESEYTLLIQPVLVDDDGSTIDGWTQVVNSKGEVIFCRSFHVSEGHFGSVTNLMGDALAKYAEKLGKKL